MCNYHQYTELVVLTGNPLPSIIPDTFFPFLGGGDKQMHATCVGMFRSHLRRLLFKMSHAATVLKRSDTYGFMASGVKSLGSI